MMRCIASLQLYGIKRKMATDFGISRNTYAIKAKYG